MGLTNDQKAHAKQTIENTLADPEVLAESIDIFLYSVFNAIFTKRIDGLISFDKAPEGSAEMLKAWAKVDWKAFLDLNPVKAGLQATGQLIVNA